MTTDPIPPRVLYPRFKTARVHLRLLEARDAAALFTHFSDPAVTRFMDIEPLETVAQAEEIIAFHARHAGCRWGLFDVDGTLIGTCGFHAWAMKPESVAEIGFDLTRRLWGQGFMREVLPQVITFGFDTMGLEAIAATVDGGNTRCQALLEGLGFKVEAVTTSRLLGYSLRPPALP